MFARMSDEWKTLWKVAGFLIVVACAVSLIGWFALKGSQTVENAFINYETFSDLYNDIKAIDRKICNHNNIPADDKAYKDLSKATQITGLRNLMERRISEYNSKTSQWNRNIWRSSEIPYKLEASNFQCYPQEIK